MQLMRPLQKRQRLVRFNRIRKSRARRDAEGRLTCMNCGAVLTGPFCHVCGQKDGEVRRPIWSMVGEILDDLFSSDSRILKSLLFLVLIPGGLTRSFMSGQRARYVMPMKLYLAISVLFFLILSVSNVALFEVTVSPKPDYVAGDAGNSSEDAEDPEAPVPMEELLASVPEDLRAALTDATPEQQRRILDLYETVVDDVGGSDFMRRRMAAEFSETLREDPDAIDRFSERASQSNSDGSDGEINLEGLNVRLKFSAINWDRYNLDLGAFVPIDRDIERGLVEEDVQAFLADNEGAAEDIVQNILRLFRQPDAFNDLFNDWLPIALFILMPVFALLLRVTHMGGRRVYLHQLVFALHFHTFLYLMMMAFIAMAGIWQGDTMGLVFWVGSSLYLIIALKVGQNQGWFSAFFKAGFIWVGYIAMVAVVLTFSVFMGITEIGPYELYQLSQYDGQPID